MMFELPLDSVIAGPWAIVTAIILATFVSEDLTCIAVGLLLATDRIDLLTALGGCFIGIVLGDLGVWLIGRFAGRQVLRWRWFRRVLSERRLEDMSRLLCRHGGRAAVVSRFVPGTRVPLFLAAGILGSCWYRFLGWALLAALVWTPILVLSVAFAGHALSEIGWWLIPVVGLGALFGIKAVPTLFTRLGRAKVMASVSKVWRWEFWPAWVFYLPVLPWLACLVLRYRSFTVWTAANPGIPAGGVVGESKADILARLPAKWNVPTLLVPAGKVGQRVRMTLNAIIEQDWHYPVILKPDAGQRGAGVKKCHDAVDVEKYLQENPDAVIVQPYHPGPFEAGIFYYRIPGEECGRIFSVTDKVFPVLIGDGRSSIEELIWSHPRYRMQAGLFLSRHATETQRVLGIGEHFPLALAGNHCQGTMFRDGGHLITPELERTVDEIARAFDGFYIGRFDVRYQSQAEFLAGRGFAVIELNGATSESTNLYDPTWSLWRAYRTLLRQWALLFRIGAANRRSGRLVVSLLEVVTLMRTYYGSRTVKFLSD